jgi:hypothetical protein
LKHIAHLLNVVDGVRDHVALGLMSDPGLSKTAQVKQWAEENGRRYCELIISQRMPSEISGMPMPVNDTRKMEIFDFDTLLQLKDGDVLAFDEFTNGNIQTLNACLTLIQERTMLSGKRLPSLVVVAMGNPQGKCDLLPQTKQRFWWVNVQWDPDIWKSYMRTTWGINVTQPVLDYITNQYRDGFGDHLDYNYHTPRTMENLFRIAKTIPRDDIFWTVSNVEHRLAEGLYQSLDNQDTFTIVQQQIMSWLRDYGDDGPSDFKTGHLLVEVAAASNTADLRETITRIEEEGTFPEFIEYLRSEGMSDAA